MDPNDNDKWDKGEEDFSDELFEDVPDAPDTPEPPPPATAQPQHPPGDAQILPPLQYDDNPPGQGLPNTPIEIDLPCIRCGYNLRSQLPGNSCPECGAPVEHSMRPDQLAWADAAWLGAVLSGVNALLLGATIAIAAFLMLCCTGVFLTGGRGGASNPEVILIAVVSMSILAIHGLFGYAAFRITTPEPGRNEPMQTCKLARPTLLAGIGLSLFSFAFFLAPDIRIMDIGGYVTLLGLAVLTVGQGLLHLYLRTLALRLPDTGLAKRTSVVFWGLTCTMGAGVLLSFMLSVIAQVRRSGGGMTGGAFFEITSMMGCMFCPIALAMLIFGILWLTLIGQYRGALVVTKQMAVGAQAHKPVISPEPPPEDTRQRPREKY